MTTIPIVLERWNESTTKHFLRHSNTSRAWRFQCHDSDHANVNADAFGVSLKLIAAWVPSAGLYCSARTKQAGLLCMCWARLEGWPRVGPLCTDAAHSENAVTCSGWVHPYSASSPSFTNMESACCAGPTRAHVLKTGNSRSQVVKQYPHHARHDARRLRRRPVLIFDVERSNAWHSNFLGNTSKAPGMTPMLVLGEVLAPGAPLEVPSLGPLPGKTAWRWRPARILLGHLHLRLRLLPLLAAATPMSPSRAPRTAPSFPCACRQAGRRQSAACSTGTGCIITPTAIMEMGTTTALLPRWRIPVCAGAAPWLGSQ